MSDRSPARLFGAVSPLALLAIGVIVIIAALLDVPWWLLLILAGVLLAGAVSIIALRSMSRADRPDNIDPFALREPWLFYVRDAQKAQREVASAVTNTADGPIRERLQTIHTRLGDGVEEVWQISNLGQTLADNGRRVDLNDLKRRLAKAEDAGGDNASQVSALGSQLESASRLDERLETTTARLDTLDAQLKDTATRALELSTVGEIGAAESLVSNVDHMVDELEALRLGLEEAG